ncbi:tetratricopeptide repeat protein [Actinomadura decatromicini]|uniref:Sel1 repeat family protein n=1 Tax=Actinomadura decatromicini TaxID=2604572 RepID=A0A5D3F8Q6_9ACTN|nr:sel1 repeat family protein [Actinomadura decatromicini]TYK44060.1 sel1 repeat family protein [Actinomadura decatromicini]
MVHQHVTAARDAYTAGGNQYFGDQYIYVDRQSEVSTGAPLGRLIGDLGEQDALALEVHQAFAAGASEQVPVLPVYLPRPGFDDRLRAAVGDAAHGSRMVVVVVGDSSTGKTRACWEAIRAELPDWRVWHPLTPERPAALAEAVRAGRVAPRTVIWLNEAQFYLQPAGGERVATELQSLLADPTRGPVLILGSMWPGFRQALTAGGDPAKPDTHRAARTLLDLAEYIAAPSGFTAAQLADLAATIETDPRLRTASTRAPSGRVTQELAGAPELLRRYEHATPAARAVLWAAMDARRLGHNLYLPEPLLHDAAPGYLNDDEWDRVGGGDWFRAALEELTARHRLLPGPLVEHRARPGEPPLPHRRYRLADYLEQHGRTERLLICPPASFWDAAAQHSRAPHDLLVLGDQARSRGRYRHAAHLYRRAVDVGDSDALMDLALLRKEADDLQGAEQFYRRAAEAGNSDALAKLALLRAEAGDHESAERLALQATDAGYPDVLVILAKLWTKAGDHEGAERLAEKAAEVGHPDALVHLAWLRAKAGDHQSAERLARQAAGAERLEAPEDQAWLREGVGDLQGAEYHLRPASDAGTPAAPGDPARKQAKPGDREGAERAALRAADTAAPRRMVFLASLQAKAGDLQGAERLYRLAVDAGNIEALLRLTWLRKRNGDHQGAERLRRFGLTAAGDVEEPWT